MKQFFLYIIVGGIATIAEWICFFFFDKIIHYFWATSLAFVFSTFVNWSVGRLILFKGKVNSLIKELMQIYSTSIIGLVLNLIIMYLVVEWIGLSEMKAKIIGTGIVFFWNFLIRKLVIYKM